MAHPSFRITETPDTVLAVPINPIGRNPEPIWPQLV
jgi:hypothetical protein